MRVCYVTAECVPFAKTGGLADVSGALPPALSRLGAEVKLFLPLYGSIPTFAYDLHQATELRQIPVEIGGRTVAFDVWYGRLPGSDVEIHLIDCPRYFHRSWFYTHDDDEDERFILFQHAVLKVLQRYHWAPDILHANDWPTALLPVYLRQRYGWDRLFDRTASVLTLHNPGYQGKFSPSSLSRAGLSYDLYYPTGPFEFYGSFSFLKAGIVFADALSTVSPTYAEEIQTPEYGEGLDGVLRTRSTDLHGILNGIDTDVWSPASDPFIPARYDVDGLDEKETNKRALLEAMGLPYDPAYPVAGIISRFAEQKGFDLLQPILAELMEATTLQLVVLGAGEQRYEDFFRWAAETYPDRVACRFGYDNPLTHRIEAGSDLFLMPSRYEPCGLNQMFSLAYGTIPVVRRTGGLADTVRDVDADPDGGNGFVFDDYEPAAFLDALLRACGAFADRDRWSSLQRRGMAEDFSWRHSAEQYLALYEKALAKRGLSIEK